MPIVMKSLSFFLLLALTFAGQEAVFGQENQAGTPSPTPEQNAPSCATSPALRFIKRRPITCVGEKERQVATAAAPSTGRPTAGDCACLPHDPLPEAIPLPRGEAITETQQFPELEVPPPSTEGSLFSRMPVPAYVNPQNGHLVIEYTLPALSRDGVHQFIIESCSLSADGTELTISRQRLYAPADQTPQAPSYFVYKMRTTVPYQFVNNGCVYVFAVTDSTIRSCDVFNLKKGQDKPAWTRRIYPADEGKEGIMPPR